jgi:hypothetical protein
MRVPELALDQRQCDPFVQQLNGVRVPQLVLVPTSAQASLSRHAEYADLREKSLLRPVKGTRAVGITKRPPRTPEATLGLVVLADYRHGADDHLLLVDHRRECDRARVRPGRGCCCSNSAAPRSRRRAAASTRSSGARSVLLVVRSGSAAPGAGGRVSAAAGCAERTIRRWMAITTTHATRLPQPWQRHSEVGAAARAEAVVARPDRARLDVSDRGTSSSSLDRQSRASTVTFVRRHGPHRRSPRL